VAATTVIEGIQNRWLKNRGVVRVLPLAKMPRPRLLEDARRSADFSCHRRSGCERDRRLIDPFASGLSREYEPDGLLGHLISVAYRLDSATKGGGED